MRLGVSVAIGCGVLALGVFACSSSSPSGAASSCTSSYDAIYAASDYYSSTLGGCDVDGGAPTPFFGVDLGADPALSTSAGRAFFLARDGDTIFELDPHCGAPRAKYVVNDPSFPGKANPQDVAVTSSGTLWVPRFNVPSLLVLDAHGNRSNVIDLSSYDPDGNPNMSAIRIAQVGGSEKAFVALEELDDRAQFS